MLPFFKIIQDQNNDIIGMVREDDMAHNVMPSKPRRHKKGTVPVHQGSQGTQGTQGNQGNHGNQGSRDKYERGLDVGTGDYQKNRKTFSANFNGVNNEIQDLEKRISRRYLIKELDKSKAITMELQGNNDYLTRKNSKLKEKLSQLVQFNQATAEENQNLKVQYEELYNQYNSIKTILEEPKVCQACIEMDQNIETIKKEYSYLRKSSQECQEDCNMLKNVVYRLNVQLERYQDKLRSHNLPISLKESQVQIHSQSQSQTRIGKLQKEYDDAPSVSTSGLQINQINQVNENHGGHNHDPVQWGRVNTHTLGPLLNAYQEIISEKEDIIESYEAEMGLFTGKLKEIIKENENLHFKLTEDEACSKVLQEQLSKIKQELQGTKEQNDLLIKKCALKQDKVEEILKCYEQKVEVLKRDYTVLHETYMKTRAEASSLKERNKSLMESQDDFKSERAQFIPVSVHTASVNECKKWYEELKQQYEIETKKLETTIAKLKEENTKLTSKMELLTFEKQQLELKQKNTDKLNKKSETKFLELEHSLHEVQLSRSACRKQLHKAMNFAKDLVNEQETLLKALNQRHMENKAVKRMGTDIASRMDILRNQLKTVQKEAWQELTTVEERIQEQDSIILSMKEEHEQEIEKLKSLIKEKE